MESEKNSEEHFTEVENYTLGVAHLHAVGKLPCDIGNVEGAPLLSMIWEHGILGGSITPSKCIEEQRRITVKFFRELNLDHASHSQLLQATVKCIRAKVGRMLQQEIEKAYLSIFQLSANARCLSGLLQACRMVL